MPTIDAVGLVVADLARAMAFYRRLGAAFPAVGEGDGHVEAPLGGVRLMLDSEESVRSFQPGYQPGSGGAALAARCSSAAAVDRAVRRAGRAGRRVGGQGAVGRPVGDALRDAAGPRRAPGRPLRRPVRSRGRRVRSPLTRYRVMAFVTGVLLLVLTVGVAVRYVDALGGDPRLSEAVARLHGWVYLVYVIVTVDLASRRRWPLSRAVLVALAGTVPFASFAAERWVVRREQAAMRRD